MTAASGGELNVIKVLLRYGADVSHKDTNGWTAEDYAVIHGYSRYILNYIIRVSCQLSVWFLIIFDNSTKV